MREYNEVGCHFDVLNLERDSLCDFVVELLWSKIVERGFLMVEREDLACFVRCTSKTYNSLPFHNFFHAVSVTQCVVDLIDLTNELTYGEKLLVSLIALSHDAGNLGFTNQFLAKEYAHLLPMQAIDPAFTLVQEYGVLSPQEKHHVVETLKLFSKHESILNACITDENKIDQLRDTILNSILSTDLLIHKTMLSESLSGRARKLKMIGLIIHAADLSNPARQFAAAYKWSNLLLEERKFELKDKYVSAKAGLASDEVGFIVHFVLPSWEILLLFLDQSIVDPWVSQIHSNVKEWRDMKSNMVFDIECTIAALTIIPKSQKNCDEKHNSTRKPLSLTQSRSFIKRHSSSALRDKILDQENIDIAIDDAAIVI